MIRGSGTAMSPMRRGGCSTSIGGAANFGCDGGGAANFVGGSHGSNGSTRSGCATACPIRTGGITGATSSSGSPAAGNGSGNGSPRVTTGVVTSTHGAATSTIGAATSTTGPAGPHSACPGGR